MESVQGAVDAYMPPELFDNVERPCAHCAGKRFWKEHTVTIAPDILMVCLNRWADAARPQLHFVEASQTLEFADNTYALRGVVSHLGNSPRSGHYVAVTRRNTTNCAWWLYNDEFRRAAQADEISTRAVFDGYGQMKSYVVFHER